MIIHDFDREARIQAALSRISRPQSARMVEYLARRQGVVTAELARETGICNLSHAARPARVALELYGLTIVAERPAVPIKDRYGQDSHQCVWRITQVA